MMMLKGHSKNNLVDFVFQVCIRLCNLDQMVFNNNQVAHVPDTLDKYLAHFQGFCFTLFSNCIEVNFKSQVVIIIRLSKIKTQ